jgi:hypothetical protein
MRLSKVAYAIRDGDVTTFEPSPLNNPAPGVCPFIGASISSLVTMSPLPLVLAVSVFGAQVNRNRLLNQLNQRFNAIKGDIRNFDNNPADCANPGNFESLKSKNRFVGQVEAPHLFRKNTPARKFMQWIVDDMHRIDRQSEESMQDYVFKDDNNFCASNLVDEIATYDSEHLGTADYDGKNFIARFEALESSAQTGPVEGIAPEDALPSTYVQCSFKGGVVTIDFTDPDNPELFAPMLKRLGWDKNLHSAQLVDQTNSRLQFKAKEGPDKDFAITVSLANDVMSASVHVLGAAGKVVLEEDSEKCASG